MIDEDALLAALLAEEGFDSTANTTPTSAQQIPESISLKPLSSLQQALVFWQSLHPHSAAYNVSRVWRMQIANSAIDGATLLELLQQIAHKQPSLRAKVVLDANKQVAHFAFNEALKAEMVDLRGLPLQTALNNAQQIAQTNSESVLPISDYLCRLTLIALPDNHWQLGADFHHLITDAWSGELWQQQLSKAFQQLATSELPSSALPVQNQFPGDALQAVAINHPLWKKADWQNLAEQALIGDKPRPAQWHSTGQQYRRPIASKRIAALTDFARSQGVSLFSPLLSLWMQCCATLRENPAASTMLCAFPFAQRPTGSEDAINCWIDTKVALLTELHDLSFIDCIQQIRAITPEMAPSLTAVVSELPQPRLADRQAFSDLHFNLEISEPTAKHSATRTDTFATGKKVMITDAYVRFDLSLDVYLQGNEGQWIVGYRPDLFSQAFIENLLTRLEALCDFALQHPTHSLPAFLGKPQPTATKNGSNNSAAKTAVLVNLNTELLAKNQNALGYVQALYQCLCEVVAPEVAAQFDLTKSHDIEQLLSRSWFELGINSVLLLAVATQFNQWLQTQTGKAFTQSQASNQLYPISLAQFYHSPTVAHFIEHLVSH